MNKENKEDPFIIIKDYRTKQSNQRVCFKVLDPNTIGNRIPNSVNLVKKPFSYEDKENYHHNFFDQDNSSQAMRKIPKPNQSHLINYDQYDFQMY